MEAWHLSSIDCISQYGKNMVVGETHKIDGEPVMHRHGYHAFPNLINAINGASGPIIWKVDLGGTTIEGHNRLVAQECTYLWKVDGSLILRKFASQCALEVTNKWQAPEVVIKFLKARKDILRLEAWYAAGEYVNVVPKHSERDSGWLAALSAMLLAEKIMNGNEEEWMEANSNDLVAINGAQNNEFNLLYLAIVRAASSYDETFEEVLAGYNQKLINMVVAAKKKN
jgi:hypothetical protein